VGKSVKFTPPAYALDDITKIPRYKRFNVKEYGCQLWWIEYGGRLDTVHDTELIKWELWKVVYGVWNYIKNSGQFPEAENLTLEWVGTIPGKRESRRFEGDYILKQQDIVEQTLHEDAVAYGGWSIDLHPADGVFSEKPGCNQWHSKGVYQIPYRCLYSRNLSNLFLAGRIISVSHVAFGSSRVMATGACVGQAVGMAAAICAAKKLSVRAILEKENMHDLQQELLKISHYIPGIALKDDIDLVKEAKVSASSEFVLNEIPANGNWFSLSHSAAQMIPLQAHSPLTIRMWVKAEQATSLTVQFRYSSKQGNHTPDVTLESQELILKEGEQEVTLSFSKSMPWQSYGFVCFLKNDRIQLKDSLLRITGLLSVFNKINPSVSNYGKQEPESEIGMEAFEFWCPDRRPKGANMAMKIEHGLNAFAVENIRSGIDRPVSAPHAWAALLSDPDPRIMLEWQEKKSIRKMIIRFDTDFDHPMESVLLTHPETTMPFCVQDIIICDEAKKQVYKLAGNYKSHVTIDFEQPICSSALTFHFKKVYEHIPVSIFGIRCYA
jgi:FAD dependent oxidoreductase